MTAPEPGGNTMLDDKYNGYGVGWNQALNTKV